jgi:two-component sensor histidine kinase
LPDGPPARKGFGTRLLERGLAQDLGPGSAVRLRFEPAGLRAEIRFAGEGAGGGKAAPRAA